MIVKQIGFEILVEMSVLWTPVLKKSGFNNISICIDVCNAGMKTDRSILTELAALASIDTQEGVLTNFENQSPFWPLNSKQTGFQFS